jgi:alpha-glucosidase
MDFSDIVRGIQFVGLPNALRALHYSRRKEYLDRAFLPPATPPSAIPPGKLQSAESIPNGGKLIFQFSELEVIFLATDLVRLTWQPGELPVPYALSDHAWKGADVFFEPAGDDWEARSQKLIVRIEQDGSLNISDINGNILRRDLPPQRQGDGWLHRSRLRPEERIYGLGERAAPLNLRPGSYRMWNRDPGGDYGPGEDPLYICIPVYLALHETGSHLTFFENSFDARFDLGEQLEAHFDGGSLRSYFTPGPPARALQRYAELTGHAPLPSRWSLGYHQSRWSYLNEGEVRELVTSFRDHDLPLDVVHLDIHYMRGYRVFTVDPKRFPDLRRLSEDLAREGVRIVTILDPGVKADKRYQIYKEGRDHSYFCKLPDGRDLLAPVWPGICSWPDFTDPEVRTWWMGHYPRLLDQGIAGIWHDMNEPAAFVAWGDPTFPLSTRHHMEGRGAYHSEAHSVYGLTMNKAGHEALRKAQPEKRPFLVSRSGWAGSQRYAWAWTADVSSSWEALRQCISSILGLGISGIPFAGTDIGGFSGEPSPELYLRWFQMATFHPFFRTHSSLTTPRREPWRFGEPALSIVRDFLRLRRRLTPYIYSLAWEANQSGQPPVRPLFWHSIDERDLWDVDDAFLLGEVLLVAPILEAGVESRSVRLPGGEWYDFWTDERFQGPGDVERQAGLDRIPLLVRAGCMLPTQEEAKLVLHVYDSEAGESEFSLYSDEGDGYGSNRVDVLQMKRSGKRLEIGWRSSGDYEFPYEGVVVHVHGFEVRKGVADEKEITIDGPRIELTSLFHQLILES